MSNPPEPFEWDPKKAQTNLEKHGVDFREAATVFMDPHAATKADPDFPEDRSVEMGLSTQGRLLVVAYCERGAKLRIISARLTTRREREAYENG